MTEKNQGTAEWLRGIVDEAYMNEAYPSCVGFARTFFGIECGKKSTCTSCILSMFTTIADRIDAERALPEGIEWPRFEDGELVKIGDEVEFEGETWKVRCAILRGECWALNVERGYDLVTGRGDYGERVKRPKLRVLGADGAPIEMGDTVYCDDEASPLTVVRLFKNATGATLVDSTGSLGTYFTFVPSRLTHERPDSWERIEEDAKLAPRDYLESRGMNPEKPERIASMMADLVGRAKALAKAGGQA